MALKQKEEISVGGLHNTMASSTTVKGDILTENDFRLDGRVEGNITCSGKLVIGPKGKVTGKVISDNAEIMGEIDGSIVVKAKLVLKASAVIKGDIQTQTIEIEPNARFNGSCVMSGEVTPQA
ncbi:polymer-forming cytoskeletal protein [Parabacteroides sp. PF5-6]|uniref:bactofilin family protein n=1 Tax=Parabacteroides sp. PF5-6 TaxID=1742403 RepID=UPI00240627E9|nr:polymer-forming cytoskeletal protein [Parabacteroides sp. PF5-6]MDF9830287.1 cytoskeletal protein CcmA (bactofilin family) [Parabacteroides sp. PF5-6]